MDLQPVHTDLRTLELVVAAGLGRHMGLPHISLEQAVHTLLVGSVVDIRGHSSHQLEVDGLVNAHGILEGSSHAGEVHDGRARHLAHVGLLEETAVDSFVLQVVHLGYQRHSEPLHP